MAKTKNQIKVVGSAAGPLETTVSPLWITGNANEKKRWFAANFDWLLTGTGHSRKAAAEKIGVDYRVILRLVSAGVSRTDDRNKENLKKLVEFFELKSVENLWTCNLIEWLLKSDDGQSFVKKFRRELDVYRKSLIASSFITHKDEIQLLGQALGQQPQDDKATLISNVEFILSSKVGKRFESVVADYLELAKYREAI